MEVIDELGNGSYGIVYSARYTDNDDDDTYALKRNLIESDCDFSGVLREIDLLVKLRRHPNIIKIKAVLIGDGFSKPLPAMGRDYQGLHNDTFHFIFEMGDCDLNKYIRRNNVPYNEIKKMSLDVMLGVEHIHRCGIIHRDMKPQNLIVKDGRIKIADFGISKPYLNDGNITPGVVTVWYRAPEVATHKTYDYLIDEWSVGCILYEMITKRILFRIKEDDNDNLTKCIIDNTQDSYLTLNEIGKIFGPRAKRYWSSNEYAPGNGLYPILRDNPKCQNIDDDELIYMCEIMDGLLRVDPNNRISVSDSIDHPYYDEYRDYINNTRKRFSSFHNDNIYHMKSCTERKFAMKIATAVYRMRGKYRWYSDMILIHAIDIFDQFLSKHDSNNDPIDKRIVEIQFYTCIYIFVKYFTTIQNYVPYKRIIPFKYSNHNDVTAAEDFEKYLVRHVMGFNIYRPTVYEHLVMSGKCSRAYGSCAISTLINGIDINGEDIKEISKVVINKCESGEFD